jgi:ribosomal protein L25 (general stress protein Ctc)
MHTWLQSAENISFELRHQPFKKTISKKTGNFISEKRVAKLTKHAIPPPDSEQNYILLNC